MFARASWILALSCLGVGCVDAAREAWVPPEIDESEILQDLGEFGHDQLCDAFEGYVHDMYPSILLVEAACTAHALETTRNATECAAVADACMQTLPAPVEEQLDRILAQAKCGGVASAGCGSMVGDLLGCLDDLGSALTNVKLTVTCAAFGSPVPPDWWRISPPESCVELVRCRL